MYVSPDKYVYAWRNLQWEHVYYLYIFASFSFTNRKYKSDVIWSMVYWGNAARQHTGLNVLGECLAIQHMY